ncbi:class F sortase [Candidatus Uhrbacteria bacterium]|nr:class F sortase [Candidatus Uhrbacteria bacterium]
METSLQVKKVQRRKTKAKSRTITRPALRRKKNFFSKKPLVFRALFVTSYTLGFIILFHFALLQTVSGFYESSVPLGDTWVTPSIAYAQQTLDKPFQAVGKPVRLKIPSIRVDAVIRHVGRTSNGAMGVPKVPRETAWYSLGPKPGEKGSAVIAGHVNWWNGAVGVFARINTLKKGDRITVQDEKGAISTFEVRRIHELGLKESSADVFLSYDGKSHLNLVTCSGIWNKITKMYSKRLVVFTDKVVE